MRDIKPVPSNKRRPPAKKVSYPEGDELFETSQVVKRAAKVDPILPQRAVNRGLPGRLVPVSQIHLPNIVKASDPQKAPSSVKGESYPSIKAIGWDDRTGNNKPQSTVRVARGEKKLIAIFLGVALVAIVISGFLFLPKADVTLTLATAPLLVERELLITGQEGNLGEAVKGTVFFKEVPVEGLLKVGNRQLVGEKARGVAVIVNRSSQEQPIKEKSRLVTADGRLFFMEKHAFVPANGAMSVPIVADLAGAEGNIEPQKLNFAALAPSAQSLVYAEVREKLVGGSGEEIAVVGENDEKAAKDEARNKIKEVVTAEIQGELPEGWELMPESWSVDFNEFNLSSAVGEKVPEITYKGRAQARVIGFEKMVLEAKLREALEKELDQEYRLFPGELSYNLAVEKVDWDQAEVVVKAKVSHTTMPDISLETLRGKLAGRSLADAKAYLEGVKGVRGVAINTWPFWVNSLPRVEARLKVDLRSDKQP